MLRLYTFGGLRIERDGQPLQLPTHKARDLLAYLIIFRNRPHPRPVLAGLLWPDLPEEKARRRLSDTLWRVRHALGDHVSANEEYIWFNTDLPYWLDVEEFERLIDWGTGRLEDWKTGRLGVGEVGLVTNLPALRKAIKLYRGDFLEGFYHDWVLLERERLRGLYLKALRQLLELYKQTGDYGTALEVAQQLVATEPFHEVAHRELMRLYHLLGRDAEAIAQYHRCRKILREELGVDPAPETEALYQVLSRRVAPLPEPMAVHLPVPARRPTFDLDEPPLVGRDAERAALLGHLEAAASGRGGVVLLEGEAGIGKTRLAQELIAGARWRNIDAILVHAGESAASSYGLLLAALSPLLTPLRLRQLARLVEPVHLQAAAPLFSHVDITDALPDMPPLPELPPPQARERLQQALVAIILGLAHIAPCLWVLEDLQWADADTLSLLPLLLPHLVDSRALFLLTGRSAELRASPAVWSALQALDRAGPFPRYTLIRLNVDAVSCLVRNLLGEDDPGMTDHLMRGSEGVPLYLVETLKTWRDEGYLLPTERGTWRWEGKAPAALPAPLGEAIIGHRLSHLSPAAEEVLAAAAAIGTEVDFELLVFVYTLSVSAPDLKTPDRYLLATDELLRLNFLVETDVGYRFSHDCVRQAVYHRLSPSRRQHLHKNIALALETLFPEQFELLAHHFIAAGQREQAIHYLTRAAERARSLFAHQTALACYDRLLELLTRPEDYPARYDVLQKRAEVLDWIGEREAQGQTIEEMLDLARALSDDTRLALALHRRSEWHRIQGRYGLANEDAQAALAIYRQLGDDHARARLLTQLGRNLLYIGECDQAEVYLQEALPILEATNDLRGQLECLMGLAYIAQYRGDHSLALTCCQRSLALAKATGDQRLISFALSAMGLGYIDLGDMDAAEPYLHQALHVAETSGTRRIQAITYIRLGYVALHRGDLDTAHARLQTALEMLREVQDTSWEAHTLSMLGELALLQNDPERAREHLEAAHRLHNELGEPDNAAISLSYLAVAELALGDETAAWEHIQQVMTRAKEWSGPERCPEVYYNYYRVAEGTRRWAVARAALEEAAEIIAERAACISDPAWREKYRTGLRVNRAITETFAEQPPPGQLRVRLARADVPAYRQPTPEELITVIWTVDAGPEDAALAEREGKVALRRHRILRLLAEAEAAGALPTVADLAGALNVTPRTIRSDLTALRRQGHPIRTRGRRV